MPHLDRDSFIALLNRLGDPDEAEALAAAREIDRRIQESGMTWSELLTPPSSAAGGNRRITTIIAAPSPMTTVRHSQPRPREGYASDTALIEELLTNQDLAPETRQELMDFKSDIAEGEFTDMDAKYLRDLHARLSRQTAPH